MKKWLKYLFVLCVLIFSTGIAMAQGPYSFSNSWSNTLSYTSPGWPGGTSVYHSIILTQGDELKHIDYSVSWSDQDWGGPTNPGGAWSNLKINLYDVTNTLVQTLETIYDPTISTNTGYYTYTGSLNFNIPILVGYKVQIEIQATASGWESNVDAASITAVTGPLCEALIFEDDFESPLNTTVWSTTTGVLPVPFSYNSTQVFGPFGNKTINLDLSALPTHSYIRVEFDLYIFDSWDGNNDNDEWKLKVDGVDRIHTDFDNIYGQSPPNNMQSYPHNVEFLNPVLTGAFQTGLPNRCHVGSSNLTSVYKINNITQHTGTSLTIGLQGLGLSGTCDESWGIDNVKVYALGIVDGCTDPTACNYDPLATCDDGSCVSGLVTIDTINIQHIACPNGGAVGIASILQSDYTNHSWLNISNGQLYNGGGGNGGLSRNDLAAGLYVITASIPTNPLCNNITYSDTFEILEASPSFNFSSNQACPDTCNLSVNADMQLAISGVSYTMFFNSNFFTFPVTIQNQCGGIYTYTILADGISCNSDVIGVSQFAPMNLQTIVVDQTCNIMGSAEVVITGVSAPGLDTYCSNSPQFNSYSIIEDVVFVGDNTSISNNTQGVCGTYVDYTVQSADVTPGSSYTVDIDLGTCSSQGTAWVDFAKVYIDWNIDGDFDDAGEMVAQISPILSPSTHSLIINIPVNAIPGQSRMRIVSQNEDYQPLNNANPCDDQVAYFGETEDYTIIVNGSVATPVSYLWSDGQNTAIATNLSSGTYYVAVTDANGCTSSDTAIINGGASNISVTATFDQTICAGYTPSSLNASSGAVAGTYSWADASNPLVILGTGSNFSPPPLTSTTTYTVTLTDNNGCVATDDIVITVSPVPSVSLTAVPNPACEGDDILLTATSSIPVNQYKFQVNNGSWSDLTSPGWLNSSSFTYNNITTTTQFRVQVKENNGCNASGWSTITVQINNITTPLISHN